MRMQELAQDKKEKLDEIGFIWDIANVHRELQWNAFYERLKEYKKVHGDCDVPRHYNEDRSLGGWVGRNRHLGRNNELSKYRRAKLDAIGFAWGESNDPNLWKKQFRKLCDFQLKEGHCRIPLYWPPDPSFARWVKYQRQRQKGNLMPDDEFKKLESIGFVWCRAKEKKALTKDEVKDDGADQDPLADLPEATLADSGDEGDEESKVAAVAVRGSKDVTEAAADEVEKIFSPSARESTSVAKTNPSPTRKSRPPKRKSVVARRDKVPPQSAKKKKKVSAEQKNDDEVEGDHRR
jgi:Helicase associated domain